MWKHALLTLMALSAVTAAEGVSAPLPDRSSFARAGIDSVFAGEIRKTEGLLRDDLAELRARLDSATTDAEKFRLVLMIRARKLTAERRLLDLQIERAERAGDADVVRRIEAARAALEHGRDRETKPAPAPIPWEPVR